jgi:hypothetical protein
MDRCFSVNGSGKGGDKPSFQERLHSADQALADLYTPVADKVAAAEQLLRDLHLPDPIFVAYNGDGVSTQLPSGGYASDSSWDCLAFRRYKGEWRLCHAKCYSQDYEDGTDPAWKPLVECSTPVRLDAVAQLGKLKVKALECKEEYVARHQTALRQLDEFLSD